MTKLTRLVPTAVLGMALAGLVALPGGNYGFAQPGYPPTKPDRQPPSRDRPGEDLPDDPEMAAAMRALRTADTQLKKSLQKRANRGPVSKALNGARKEVRQAQEQCKKAWKLEKEKRR